MSEMPEISMPLNENKNEVIILSPDHPLMSKFQSRLKSHLEKQASELDEVIRSLKDDLKKVKKADEDVLLDIYNIRKQIDKITKENAENENELQYAHNDRCLEQNELEDVQNKYDELIKSIQHKQKDETRLRLYEEYTNQRLVYLSNISESSLGNLKTICTTARKASADVKELKQNVSAAEKLIETQWQNINAIGAKSAMYKQQQVIYQAEVDHFQQALHEINAQLDAIHSDKKHTMRKCNQCIVAIHNQQSVLLQLKSSLCKVEEQMQNLNSMMKANCEDILRADETFENMCIDMLKCNEQSKHIQEKIESCQHEQQNAKSQYELRKTQILKLEHNLKVSKKDERQLMAEDRKIDDTLMELSRRKKKLTDDILEAMQNVQQVDKCAKFAGKTVLEARSKTDLILKSVCDADDLVAAESSIMAENNAELTSLQQQSKQIEENINHQTETTTSLEAQLKQNELTIKKRQQQVDQKNKKVDSLVKSSQGIELGPLEIQILSLNQSISDENVIYEDLCSDWLKKQTELIQSSEKLDAVLLSRRSLESAIDIFESKRLKIRAEIEQQNKETVMAEKSLKNMLFTIEKLNVSLCNEKSNDRELENEYLVNEKDFTEFLKCEKKDVVKLQIHLQRLNGQRDELAHEINALTNEIIFWTKKLELTAEIKEETLSSNSQSQTAKVKARIHRLTLDLSNIMKNQESVSNQMQNAVSRLESIKTKSTAADRSNSGKSRSASSRIARLRTNLKAIKQELVSVTKQMDEVQEETLKVEQQNFELNRDQDEASGALENAKKGIQVKMDLKQINLLAIVAKQNEQKLYQELQQGKYRPRFKSEAAVNKEHAGQIQKLKSVMDIIANYTQLNPQKSNLQNIYEFIAQAIAK